MSKDLAPLLKALETEFAAQASEYQGQTKVVLPAEHIVAALTALRDQHGFEMLAGLSAVDYWPQREPRFHVIYEMKAMKKKLRLEVRVPLDGDEPLMDSVIEVYPVANWHERELWDMFGIRFNNHPDMRRILMPEDWVGHPLRKDYPLGYEEVQFSFNFEEIEQRKPRPKD